MNIDIFLQNKLVDLSIHPSSIHKAPEDLNTKSPIGDKLYSKSDEVKFEKEIDDIYAANDTCDCKEEIDINYNGMNSNMNYVNEDNMLNLADCSRSLSDISKGYLIIYGGSCHNEDVTNMHVAYGSMVIDFHDFKVLDLDTLVWLPIVCTYPKCRGGIHALVECSKGWLLSGGMQTEAVADMPRFKNDLTYVIPNFRKFLKLKCDVVTTDNENEHIRITNRFYSAKA